MTEDGSALLLSQLDAVFFDLDGCLYRGETMACGADELLAELRGRRLRIGFITNNSRQGPHEIADKLTRMGIVAYTDEIVTAGAYAGQMIAERFGSCKVKAAGSEWLKRSLRDAGHTLLPLGDEEAAQVVVVGRDTAFTYDKLQYVVDDLERGAVLVATNADLSHPGAGGRRIPETGALVAAVEAAAGRPGSALFAGKPEPHLFRHALYSCGLVPERCLMVGDNLHTDIVGAHRSGMRSAWLNDGADASALLAAANEKEAAVVSMPTYIVRDCRELLRLAKEGER